MLRPAEHCIYRQRICGNQFLLYFSKKFGFAKVLVKKIISNLALIPSDLVWWIINQTLAQTFTTEQNGTGTLPQSLIPRGKPNPSG